MSNNWQEMLLLACSELGHGIPQYQLASELRGGRTAWTSFCVVLSRKFQSRFWYDGDNIYNSMEDAAEQAVLYLQGANPSYRFTWP